MRKLRRCSIQLPSLILQACEMLASRGIAGNRSRDSGGWAGVSRMGVKDAIGVPRDDVDPVVPGRLRANDVDITVSVTIAVYLALGRHVISRRAFTRRRGPCKRDARGTDRLDYCARRWDVMWNVMWLLQIQAVSRDAGHALDALARGGTILRLMIALGSWEWPPLVEGEVPVTPPLRRRFVCKQAGAPW